MTTTRLLSTILLVSGLTLAGCDQQGPAEQAGEKIDETVEQAEEKIEDTLDANEGPAEEAGEAIDEAVEETKETVKDVKKNIEKQTQ